MLRSTPIRDVMVTNPITIYVRDRFSRVEEKMRIHHIRHLPVLDDQQVLVGLITQRDLFRAVSPRETDSGYVYDKTQLDSFILSHFMTREPFTLHSDDSVMECVEAMVTKKYGCIPIVDNERRLVGIVTQVDILRFVARHF